MSSQASTKHPTPGTNQRWWLLIAVTVTLPLIVVWAMATLMASRDNRDTAAPMVHEAADQRTTSKTADTQTYASFRHGFAIEVPFDWVIEERAAGPGYGEPTLSMYKGKQQASGIYFASPETWLEHEKNLKRCLNDTGLCDYYIPASDFSVWKVDDKSGPRPDSQAVMIGDWEWHRRTYKVYEQEHVEYFYFRAPQLDSEATSFLVNVHVPEREEEVKRYLNTFVTLDDACLRSCTNNCA